MLRFKQHIPNFMDFEPKEFEYDSFAALLTNPIVSKFKDRPEFVRFSKSVRADGDKSQILLMAEYTKDWLVVGYLSEAHPELPWFGRTVTGLPTTTRLPGVPPVEVDPHVPLEQREPLKPGTDPPTQPRIKSAMPLEEARAHVDLTDYSQQYNSQFGGEPYLRTGAEPVFCPATSRIERGVYWKLSVDGLSGILKWKQPWLNLKQFLRYARLVATVSWKLWRRKPGMARPFNGDCDGVKEPPKEVK